MFADGVDPARKPNVIFIVSDQLRNASLGYMGNSDVITPNIDQIASESITTKNAIACQPVCTPFRAQLMTGKYSHTTGVIKNDKRLPDSEVTIAELLKQNGYTTGYIGKWHLSGGRKNPVDKINRRGWDFWAVRNSSHQHHAVKYWLNDSKNPIHAKGWEPHVQTNLAIKFIEQNKDKPFSLFISFGPPHNPYKAPSQYTALYKNKNISLRPNTLRNKKNLINLKAYYSAISGIDDCMGKLNAAIKEKGLYNDTIIIFTADHGDMLGSQGQRLKQRPWEESINIPFFIRYPACIPTGQQRDFIISSVDFMPTVLGFTGIDIPDSVQGMDHSAMLFGTSNVEREAAFLFNIHNGRNGPGSDWRGIRTKEWVYAYHAKGDWVMYNLIDDPYELHNLIDDPSYFNKKQELKDQLDQMRSDLGDNMPLKGKNTRPIKLPKNVNQ